MMEAENNKNIVLVGMPGAGKSYIGNKLAKLLVHFTYVDIDEKIENSEGMTISKIFEEKGEKYFRTIESKAIKEVSKIQNQIISLGGGAFQDPENVTALKYNGISFYLKAPIEEIYNRIKDDTHRPLLDVDSPKEALKKLLRKREKNYLKAHFTIDTTKKQAYTILDDILKEYENYVKQRT